MRNRYFHGVFFLKDLGHRPWVPWPSKCGFFPENPNANKKSLSNAMGGHESWMVEFLVTTAGSFFSKMTSRRTKKKRNGKNLHTWEPANLYRSILSKSGGTEISFGEIHKRKGWSFLSKNFLRFHWRDSLAHRWKRLRTRQGTWGFLLPHGGVGHRNQRKEAIYHSQGPILDSQVLTYQFLRFCLWHIFVLHSSDHQVNILNCNFCSSTFEATGGV